MIRERLKYELNLIVMRVAQLWPEYERTKSVRQEHIMDIKFNKKKYTVTIMMCTCCYVIRYDEDHYLVEWFRKKDDELIKDGFVECADLAAVVRTVDDFIHSGFSPARGPWWMLNKKPQYNRRNKRWA